MTGRSLPSTIAIDGPAASGKSMLGRALAERLGYAFFDTGLMYRAFTVLALRRGVGATDAAGCAELAVGMDLRFETGREARILLGSEDVTGVLRSAEVEANVSAYSALPAVRAAMATQQRALAARGSAILAGRDIGTVVLPEAPLKLYLEASEEARTRRRAGQTGEWGAPQAHADARRDISGRDRVDSAREASPLRPASDAIVIDTTDMTIGEVIEQAMEHIRCATG
ncbi:MAG: (d)CMP kinase [Tepidiformaceae bacterium]